MRRWISRAGVWGAAFLMACTACATAKAQSFTEPSSAASYVAEMGTGFNVGNYLDSAVIGAPGGFISPTGLTAARNEGKFSNIRIPVNFPAHADAAGKIDELFLSGYVDPLVDESLARFPRVVLDMHGYLQIMNQHTKWGEFPPSTANFTVDQHATRLTAMWTQIATRYAQKSKRLSFDLLNEPFAMPVSAANLNATTPPGITSAQWNALIPRLVSAIRATGGNNATRMLWAETYGQANLSQLGALQLPADANLGVSVHIYDPFAFTHGTTTVALTPHGLRQFLWALQTAKAWADANGRVMYVGEVGANNKPSSADRLTYYQAIREYSAQVGLPFSYWNWTTDFGIYRQDNTGWIPGMQAAVSGLPGLPALPALPPDTTPTVASFVGPAPSQFQLDAANQSVSWAANTSIYTMSVLVRFPDLPAVANGQKWAAYAKTYSGTFTIGLDLIRPTGATYSMAAWGYTPNAPGGYEQPIGNALPGDILTLRIKVPPGAPAGRVNYAVWRAL